MKYCLYKEIREKKSKIVVLATGGTIAGIGKSPVLSSYDSGVISAEGLLGDLPDLNDYVTLVPDQFSNIPSQDIDGDFMLRLADRVAYWLEQETVDGVVITHGTDTMEETAYFLHLTTASSKPVVLTGAMRPATAASADGPMNLVNAITLSATPLAHDLGVTIVMNETILSAESATKSNTTAVNTFVAPNTGPLGQVRDLTVTLQNRPLNNHTVQSELLLPKAINALPKVGIVYAHADHDVVPIKAFCEAGFKGLVIAGMGNGSISSKVAEYVKQEVKKGLRVVRSSRCFSGAVTSSGEVDDVALGLIPSAELNPQKARIRLQLALLKTKDVKALTQLF